MRFPLFALITPVITSVVLWLVTGSAYTLLFALLGPVMAVAQYFDARWQARREEARQEERQGEEILAQAHQQQLETFTRRQDALVSSPPSSRYAEESYSLRPRWAAGEIPQGTSREVRIGTARVGGMPLLIDITKGLAISGQLVEALSVQRAIAFQLAWLWGIDELGRAGMPERDSTAEFSRAQAASVSVVSSKEDIAFGVRYFLEVDRGFATLHDTIDPSALPVEVVVDLLSTAEASLIHKKLHAERPYALAAPAEIPSHVSALVNREEEWASARDSLVVNVGRGCDHPLLLDLVSAGPHAVVTGMTGSGKTEFLRTWLVAMASCYSPAELAILAIDFKGGAGFSRLSRLPHIVGVVTDLDHAEALRAITSLRAEIHYREHILAQEKISDISQLRTEVDLSRLIVVVDEFRAVLDTFPELVNAFVDLAARGRALGIHVILSSQRVGGSVGESLLANCAVRVGFRVSQKQDSQSLLGNDLAYALPHIPGRAVVMGTGQELREFQAAVLDTGDVDGVIEKSRKWCDHHPEWSARSPWLPPLPRTLSLTDSPEAPEGVAWLGLVDIPQQQVQSWAHYSPTHDGNLLITGPARTGVSNTLATLATQLGVPMITDAEEAWDAVVENINPPTPLIIDELDGILDEFDLEHREQFVAALTSTARQAPKQGNAVVLGCSELIRGVSSLLALFPEVVKLNSASSPGRGTWRDHEIQLVHLPRAAVDTVLAQHMSWSDESAYVVITHRKREMLAKLEKSLHSRVTDLASELSVTTAHSEGIYLGTPDEWMARSSLLASLRSEAVFVLDGCTTSELRGLRLRSGLFPHLGYEKTLVVEPEGSTTRVVI